MVGGNKSTKKGITNNQEMPAKTLKDQEDTEEENLQSFRSQKVAMSNEGGKWYQKDNFCQFCLTLQPKLHIHLLNQHMDQKRVLEASLLPPKNKLRRQILGELRIEGNAIYNKSKCLNPEGNIIAARRQRIPTKEHQGFKKKKLLTQVKIMIIQTILSKQLTMRKSMR